MPKINPLYPFSLKEAVSLGEKDLWRESYLENCDCARAIERAIDEHYDGQRLNSCAKEVIDRYGFDRVNFVLANTVRQSIEDGRYSEDNKKWARRFSVMDKEHTWQYHVRSHPGIVNLFVADARRQWDKLGLYDGSQCDSERSGQLDYTDRILVLNPSVLKDECKRPQDQLFTPPTAMVAAPIPSARRCSDSMCRTEKNLLPPHGICGRTERGTHPRMGKGKHAEIS